jgi:hypothetical protein
MVVAYWGGRVSRLKRDTFDGTPERVVRSATEPQPSPRLSHSGTTDWTGSHVTKPRLLIRGLALAALVIVLVPLIAAYLGPIQATQVMMWRTPWIRSLTVELYDSGPSVARYGAPELQQWPQLAETVARYWDPYPLPSDLAEPGEQTRFVIFGRRHPLLPWVPIAGGTGP